MIVLDSAPLLLDEKKIPTMIHFQKFYVSEPLQFVTVLSRTHYIVSYNTRRNTKFPARFWQNIFKFAPE